MIPISRSPGSQRETLEVRSPTDGALIESLPVDSPESVVATVMRVRSAQAAWGALPLEDRVRRLGHLLPVLRSRTEDVVRVIRAETGKPEVEALAELTVVIDVLRYYLKHARNVLGPQRRGTGWVLGKTATVYREPFGVIGVISPWNYPFILAMNPVLTALFAGNGVVVKPSEHAPLSALLVLELLNEAHIPSGLVGVVVGGPEVGAALVTAGVDKIAFTGGRQAGRAVMRAAAEQVIPVCLELGGKDPAIVLDDADLGRAVPGILFGAFFNAGQTCISIERAFVVAPVYEAFLERITHLAEELRPGVQGMYDIGPITTPQQLTHVDRHIADARGKGARVLSGGDRADPASNLVVPTILVDVDDDMMVLTEETFGPVLVVLRVEDAEDAVKQANQGPGNLFASIWTRDRKRGEALARQIHAGGVSINDVLTHYAIPGVPMGGVGLSGFGRTGGPEGLLELSRTRTVLSHRWGLGRKEFFWFPYDTRTAELFRGLTRWRAGGGLRRLVRALLGRGS